MSDHLKNFLISGVKNVIENKLNKNSSGGEAPPPSQQQSQHGDMNYGGYPPPSGSYPPPGGYPQAGSYPQGGYGGYPPGPQQGGYPGGVRELDYNSGGGSSSPYPSGPGYSQNAGGGAPIGFNANHSPYPSSAGSPYPPLGGGAAPSPYPPVPSGYPPYHSGGYVPQQQTSAYPPVPQQPQFPHPPQQGYPNQFQQQQHHNPAPRCPGMWGTPSIRPVPGFNAQADAEVLRKAMKGLGCNNSKIISVLCARSNDQRQQIAQAFKVMYGKDFLSDLRSELSGDFEDLILALMEQPARYDAMQLYKAMAGLGTKESVLIEITTTRTNEQVQLIKTAYRQLYRRELEADLIGDTSGCFKRLLVSLSACGRDESGVTDPLRANQDARHLLSAGERKLGTDESCFNSILAAQNFAQLRLVFDEYNKMTNHSIEKAIESEFSGDIRDGFLAVCAVVRNKPAYLASLLFNSMKGLGTRDNNLIRVVVSRCEVDMVEIRHSFQSLYKQSLEHMIKGDCSGAYKDGLIALVNGN